MQSRHIFLILACVTSTFTLQAIIFKAPMDILTDQWDGPAIVVATLLWIAFMIRQVGDSITGRMQQQIDQLSNEVNETRLSDIDEMRRSLLDGLHEIDTVKRVLLAATDFPDPDGDGDDDHNYVDGEVTDTETEDDTHRET